MSENQRTYPYKAWTLLPSGKPIEREMVSRYDDWNTQSPYDQSATGKVYDSRKLHETKASAIAEGLRQVELQQKKLDKQQATLSKRRKNLLQAQGSA